MTSNRTRHALLMSITSILVCIAMLIGSTFAWFTDTAETKVNSIVSGTFDVELVKPDKESDKYDALGSDPLKWVAKDGRDQAKIFWEPGASYDLESFRIKNNGNLALKYKVIISGIVGNAELLNAIDFKVTVSDGDALVAKDGTSTVSTVATLNNFEGTLAAGAVTGKITITGTMKDTAGNEYQGKSIEGIGITVIATQNTVESDSTDDQYDVNAQYPVYTVADVTDNITIDNSSGSEVTKIKSEMTIQTTEKVSGKEDAAPTATAKIPENVVLEPGVTQLKFVIDENSVTNNIEIDINSSTQAKKTLEIKLEGVSENNTVPNILSFYIETGLRDFEFYHTENSNNNKMNKITTSENDVKKHNDYYYESKTGKVTMAVATFSPFTYTYDITPVVDTPSLIEALNKNGNIVVDKAFSFDGAANTGLDTILTAPGHVHLILNNTLTTSDDVSGYGWGLIRVTQGATLEISANENGKFINTQSNSLVNVCGGDVIINGGYFESTEACFFYYTDYDSAISEMSLTINDGTFKAGEDEGVVYNPARLPTTGIAINGGTFYNWNPGKYVNTSTHTVAEKTSGTDTIYTVTAK